MSSELCSIASSSDVEFELSGSVSSEDVKSLNVAVEEQAVQVECDDDETPSEASALLTSQKAKQKKKRRNRRRRAGAAKSKSLLESDSNDSLDNSADDKGMCGLTDLVNACLAKSTTGLHDDGDDDVDVVSSGRCDGDNAGGDVVLAAYIRNGSATPTATGLLCSGVTVGRLLSSNGPTSGPQPFLRASLFSNVPPTIRFYTKGTKVSKPTRKITSRLMWCHNSLLPIVMRNTLAASHFTVVDESLFHIGYWGRHLKSSQYKSLKPYQKVNHFPGAFHIGRKDRLWMHIRRLQDRFEEEFEIMPFTYILPQDREELLEYLREDDQRYVIIKPPASARGTGIHVSRRQNDFPASSQLVAQHYIDRPMTINGAKFDLRLYAYVPTLEPLRVYIYEQGLVRFASLPYSKCVSTISNKYMHLTNYSINKLAEQDGVANRPVPKWTLAQLWRYFDERGIKSATVRAQIEETVIKAFIACEKPIRDHMVKYLQHGFICHELFGIDILLDEDLKPWLLEVNISPSLHSGTPLDVSVKAPLAKDVLNMAGIYVPPRFEDLDEADYSTRPRNWPKSREQLIKEASWVAAYQEELGELDPRILRRLTPEDTRMLVEFEDELQRCGDFRLIFPTLDTVPMQTYFAEPLYANLLLQLWQLEQAADREEGIARLEQLCRQGHMKAQMPSPRI